MILIKILGLDQYVVGHYSKENSANLANLYEVDEDEINFFAPQSIIFHAGVDQTSWNTLVIVRAPAKYGALESKISSYILKTLNFFSINVEVQFEYYEEHHSYTYVNEEYPRFITEDNLMDVNVDYEGEDEAPDFDPANPESVYLGNVFEEHKDDMERLEAQSEVFTKKEEPKVERLTKKSK